MIERIAAFARSHGHQVTVFSDHLIIWIAEGNGFLEGFECKTLGEVRDALGY